MFNHALDTEESESESIESIDEEAFEAALDSDNELQAMIANAVEECMQASSVSCFYLFL
jgi:hypothetical protein